MDPITLTIVIRGCVSALFVVAAIWMVYQAVGLYHAGIGANPEKSTLQVGKFKVTTTTASAFLLGVAALALMAGVWTAPTVTKDKDNWKVASFSAGDNEAKVEPIIASLPGGEIVPLTDPQALKGLFNVAVSGQAQGSKAVFLNGKPAKFDLNSLSAVEVDNGKYLVTSKVRAGDHAVLLTFRPERHYGEIVFYPVGGIFDASEFGPKPSKKAPAQQNDSIEPVPKKDATPTPVEPKGKDAARHLREGQSKLERAAEDARTIAPLPPPSAPVPQPQEVPQLPTK